MEVLEGPEVPSFRDFLSFITRWQGVREIVWVSKGPCFPHAPQGPGRSHLQYFSTILVLESALMDPGAKTCAIWRFQVFDLWVPPAEVEREPDHDLWIVFVASDPS